QAQQRLHLRRRAAGRGVLLVQLDEAEPQVAGALEGLLGVELAEAVALGADREVAEADRGPGGLPGGLGPEDAGQARQAQGGGPGPQEAAAVEGGGLLCVHGYGLLVVVGDSGSGAGFQPASSPGRLQTCPTRNGIPRRTTSCKRPAAGINDMSPLSRRDF